MKFCIVDISSSYAGSCLCRIPCFLSIYWSMKFSALYFSLSALLHSQPHWHFSYTNGKGRPLVSSSVKNEFPVFLRKKKKRSRYNFFRTQWSRPHLPSVNVNYLHGSCPLYALLLWRSNAPTRVPWRQCSARRPGATVDIFFEILLLLTFCSV